eukprot:scaffold575_cov121-Skeletonema_menzelii.AAC.1
MSGPSEATKRRRVTRSAGADVVDDGLSCCFCKESIPYSSECVELESCGCTSCTRCLLECHGKRGRTQPACPCGETICAHKFLSAMRVPEGGVINYKQEDESELRLRYPLEYVTTTMKEEFGSIGDGGEMLCLWGVRFTKSGEKTTRSNVLKIVTRRNSCVSSYTDSAIDELCRFSAWLSPSITAPSIVERKHLRTMSPRDFLEDAFEKYSPLMAVLFGLATAKSARDKDKILGTSNHPDYQSQYLAIAMAHDIIIRSNLTHPYRGQLMLNNIMEMERISNGNRDILSAVRILPSRDFTDTNMRNNVVSKMMMGVELDQRGLLYLNFDNIGFKMTGLNAGYSPYTLFQEIHVKEPRLRELNIYNNDPTQQLSREREHRWVDLCELDRECYPEEMRLAESLVANTQADFDALTLCICFGILNARAMVIEENLAAGRCIPNPAYIVNEDTYNDVTRRAVAQRGGTVPSTAASAPTVDDNDDQDDEDEYQPSAGSDSNSEIVTRELPIHPLDPDEVDLPASTTVSNMYGDNTNLISIREDLSKLETVAAIMDFVWECRTTLLRKSREEEPDFRPAAEIGCFLMCDGQPAHQITKLIAQDNRNFYLSDNNKVQHINYDEDDSDEDDLQPYIERLDGYSYGEDTKVKSKYHDKIFVSFGVFHATLKMHNCRGLMFVTMLDEFFSSFRNTPNRRKWVIFPSDPRQLEDELPQIICAHYASAFINCWEDGKTKGIYRDGEYPSVKDVHKYMLGRAAKYPFLKAVLNDIRYAEIAKMMKMSAKIGKRGSVDLWLTSVRFALTLWSTTHATEYVRLGCELLRCWHCFSPAEKQLYSNEVFTRLTANGKPEAADLNMEKSVLHVRNKLGKNDREGMEIKMEGACNKITEESTGREVKSQLR